MEYCWVLEEHRGPFGLAGHFEATPIDDLEVPKAAFGGILFFQTSPG